MPRSIKKRFTVFISSTYEDLKEERQALVSAILKAGHIPQGMELFSSGNLEQWDLIKEWIDDSDVFCLLLAFRHGSICPHMAKPYTQLEYEYALERKKPFFSLVMDRSYEPVIADKSLEFIKNKDQIVYDSFRAAVVSKLVAFPKNIDQIQLMSLQALHEIERSDLDIGWIRAKDAPQDNTDQLLSMVRKKDSQIDLLEEKIRKLETTSISDGSGEKIQGLCKSIHSRRTDFAQVARSPLEVFYMSSPLLAVEIGLHGRDLPGSVDRLKASGALSNVFDRSLAEDLRAYLPLYNIYELVNKEFDSQLGRTKFTFGAKGRELMQFLNSLEEEDRRAMLIDGVMPPKS
jgi:hypothetical protein